MHHKYLVLGSFCPQTTVSTYGQIIRSARHGLRRGNVTRIQPGWLNNVIMLVTYATMIVVINTYLKSVWNGLRLENATPILSGCIPTVHSRAAYVMEVNTASLNYGQ